MIDVYLMVLMPFRESTPSGIIRNGLLTFFPPWCEAPCLSNLLFLVQNMHHCSATAFLDKVRPELSIGTG